MLTAQKKTFSLAGMSPKSSNMTAKSGINTADTSKVYHLLVVGADALTMSEITVDGVSVEKVSGCAREFLVVDGFLCSRSDSTKTFVHARDVNEMSAMYCASGSSNSEFSESIKKSLPLSAHLMRPEALTVAAIDAGNLLYVAQVLRDKFPSAQIIIAADNDHSEGRQNTGRIAAEKAALSVSGWVALPPTDHKADWNDYHQKHGIKCATEAFNKSMYQPQGNGVKQEPQTIEGSDFKVMDTDPLKPRIESREDGIYWVSPRADSQSGEIINNESWLCSPLSVIGTGRDDKDQYLILRWLSFGSETPTTAAIPLADIGEREGWRTLKAGGVNVTTKSSLRAILADWLQRSGSRELWRVAHATGWQCGAYIMPDGEIIGTPENPVLFSGRSSAAAGYTVSGSAKSWRDNVARLAFGNYSMMTGIGAALAAPLIGLVGADGFGIHFYEQSSAGKTTTANVASSLYGNPDLLRLTWYGTALGLANEAAAHNDGLMPLDEVGQGADPVSVSQSAYALFNGVGKLQGAKDGGNRDLKRWRTVAISTGEMDLETFIATSGRKTKAGQLVRLLNIPLSKAVRFHDYQNLVSAEATGGLGSTATSNQLSSIAPMLYNNWLSGQMQNYGNLLNVGMNAASGQATAGQNYANNTGQLLQGLGAIRAGQAQQPSSLARGIGGAASGALAGAQLGSVVPGISG